MTVETVGKQLGLRWRSTMLRIKDPSVSIPFYEQNFGMKLVHQYDYPEKGYSLYYLERFRDGVDYTLTSKEATEKHIWTADGNMLELHHDHGSEKNDKFTVASGNVEPYRGFGHIAFFCDNVYKAAEELETKGVPFQKKIHEGRMKHIAFCKDPDGYWIELIGRGENTSPDKFNLSQTMIRVKDAKQSLDFYTKSFGMTLIHEKHFSDFSLYFLVASKDDIKPHPDLKGAESGKMMHTLWSPVLELTHNFGTEDDPKFSYHTGIQEPKGFGHISFVCDDLDNTRKTLQNAGIKYSEELNKTQHPGRAFFQDPDGYLVEVVQQGLKSAA